MCVHASEEIVRRGITEILDGHFVLFSLFSYGFSHGFHAGRETRLVQASFVKGDVVEVHEDLLRFVRVFWHVVAAIRTRTHVMRKGGQRSRRRWIRNSGGKGLTHFFRIIP